MNALIQVLAFLINNNKKKNLIEKLRTFKDEHVVVETKPSLQYKGLLLNNSRYFSCDVIC